MIANILYRMLNLFFQVRYEISLTWNTFLLTYCRYLFESLHYVYKKNFDYKMDRRKSNALILFFLFVIIILCFDTSEFLTIIARKENVRNDQLMINNLLMKTKCCEINLHLYLEKITCLVKIRRNCRTFCRPQIWNINFSP